MDFKRLAGKIEEHGIKLLLNEPMSRHTSFRIGGKVALLALPKTEEELIWLCALSESPLVFGNGSNLLVTDEPINRLAIKTTLMCGVGTEPDGALCAGAGALLSRAALFAAENGLTGMEFAHGIPGTIGGAVMMNAGAYGGEMAQIVSRTRFLDEKLEIREVSGVEHCFAYRESVFSYKKHIILSSRLELAHGEHAAIRARMDELSQKRRASQPLDKPSAGSTFKRPAQGYAAALIDAAGLKGFAIGGAQVSEKHAGFVVNTGAASFQDVLRLMEHIQKTVFDRSGVELIPELRVIGG